MHWFEREGMEIDSILEAGNQVRNYLDCCSQVNTDTIAAKEQEQD
jgi:hypothetical protein